MAAGWPEGSKYRSRLGIRRQVESGFASQSPWSRSANNNAARQIPTCTWLTERENLAHADILARAIVDPSLYSCHASTHHDGASKPAAVIVYAEDELVQTSTCSDKFGDVSGVLRKV